MKRLSLALLLLFASVPAQAILITSNTSDASVGFGSGVPAGQSVTTSAGGPWTDITFSWINGAASADPRADGTLYLLSMEYLGDPAALSGATPGFIASASDTGTEYTFAAGVTLQPNTQYWFYTDGNVSSYRVNFADAYAGGNLYQRTLSSFPNYASNTARDAKFVLNGTVSVPEPASVVLLGLAVVALALMGPARRRGAVPAQR